MFNLVVSADIEEQVISVILELASADSLDDFRTEAVAVSNQIVLIIIY